MSWADNGYSLVAKIDPALFEAQVQAKEDGATSGPVQVHLIDP
jgi:hypothetical protein